MSHDARLVANYLLQENSEGKCENPLTPMQVLKLVYICHGWMLGLYKQSLITQDVEAWRYGPVISDLYHAIKHYKANPVTQRIDIEQDSDFSEIEKDLMDQVNKKYGHMSGPALSILTHTYGSPWFKTWHEKGGWAKIPTKLIKEHFVAMANQNA